MTSLVAESLSHANNYEMDTYTDGKWQFDGHENTSVLILVVLILILSVCVYMEHLI